MDKGQEQAAEIVSLSQGGNFDESRLDFSKCSPRTVAFPLFRARSSRASESSFHKVRREDICVSLHCPLAALTEKQKSRALAALCHRSL